jgi:hypothetical protein
MTTNSPEKSREYTARYRAPMRRAHMTFRKRPLVHLSLSPAAIARLAEIATRCGETRSGVVERLIREAEMPRPKTAGTRPGTV